MTNKFKCFKILLVISFLISLIFLSCSNLGEGLKSVFNPGYNSWTIEYEGDYTSVSEDLESLLKELEFEIESKTSSKIETSFRSGAPRYSNGGFFSALGSFGAQDGEIKLIIEDRFQDGRKYLQFTTYTDLKNRYSSYNRSEKSNPDWSLWEDELLHISQTIKKNHGKSNEVGKYFLVRGGDKKLDSKIK